MTRWHVRPDPANFEAIIYDDDGYFICNVHAGERRDEIAQEIVNSHNHNIEADIRRTSKPLH